MSVWRRIRYGTRLGALAERTRERLSGDWARVLFGTLFVAATLVLVGVVTLGLPEWVPAEYVGLSVPGYVFVFAALGSTTYGLTSLAFDFEKSPRELVQLGFRVVAALPLAAGVFVLLGVFLSVPDGSGGSGTGDPSAIAGVAFLTGLYTKLALSELGRIASRFYGNDDSGGDLSTLLDAERTARKARAMLADGAYDAVDEQRRQRMEEALSRVESLLDDGAAPETLAEATERLRQELPASDGSD